MLLKVYKILSNFLIIPIILYLLIRLIKKKETFKSFREKLGFSKLQKPTGKIIWIHAVSIGEALSAIPLVKEINKEFPSLKILFTTSTKTSARIIKERSLINVYHHFIPLDIDIIIQKFISFWDPQICIIFESEFWPNLILNLKKKKIPIILVNGRISEKSYNFWSKFPSTSKKLFSNFNLCLAQNKFSEREFTKLGFQRISYFGNFKFFSEKLPFDESILKDFRKKLKGKFIITLASSHELEEELILKNFTSLKNNFRNLFLIIVPRHIDRSRRIQELLKSSKTKYNVRSLNQKIDSLCECYLADTVGELGLFYSLSNCVLMGGSLTPRGGQNPIEPAHFNCPIILGPYMDNFKDISNTLVKNNAVIMLEKLTEIESSINKIYNDNNFAKLLSNNLLKVCQSELKKKDIIWKEINHFIKKI